MKKELEKNSELIDMKISSSNYEVIEQTDLEFVTIVNNIEKIKYIVASEKICDRYSKVELLIKDITGKEISDNKEISKFLFKNGIFKKSTLFNISVTVIVLITAMLTILLNNIVHLLGNELSMFYVFCFGGFVALLIDYLFNKFVNSKIKTYRLSDEFKDMKPYKEIA